MLTTKLTHTTFSRAPMPAPTRPDALANTNESTAACNESALRSTGGRSPNPFNAPAHWQGVEGFIRIAYNMCM